MIAIPNARGLGPPNPGPYAVYHSAGEWLTQNTLENERVLDLTDWSLYFSRRPGYSFANLYEAPGDPRTRWIVVRDRQIDGPEPYGELVRTLIRGRDPVACLPSTAAPNQLCIRVYDRRRPATETADATSGTDRQPWRR